MVPRFNWRKVILTMSVKGKTDAFRLLLDSDVVRMLASIKSHSASPSTAVLDMLSEGSM